MEKDISEDYRFPEKRLLRAMEATEPEFDISVPGREPLYVETLQQVRSPRQFQRIERELGIIGGKLQDLPNRRAKIIFSGHRGSGKTVELLRFHEAINRPDRYFSVFIPLQKEIEITRMESEDLYFILIKALIQELKRRNIRFDEQEFEEIAEEWVRDAEIQRELRDNYKLETGDELAVGFNFWNLFAVKGLGKTMYGYDNATTTKIRRTIQINPGALSRRLNAALQGVAVAIREAGQGQDLLFIVDDFEKTRPEVYRKVFVEDPQFFMELRAHFICCVPISTFYEIQEQEATAIFTPSYLPMIRVENPEAQAALSQVITRRADASLFEQGVLDEIVRMSGGSPRQLLQIANQSLLNADADCVSMDTLRYTLNQMTVDRERRLTAAHKKLLAQRQFHDISRELLDLLFAVNVMEYNGDHIERRLNPLLEPLFAPK